MNQESRKAGRNSETRKPGKDFESAEGERAKQKWRESQSLFSWIPGFRINHLLPAFLFS
jgi:hypothetical protein